MPSKRKSKRCNKCQGKGEFRVGSRKSHSYPITLPCTACKGTGKVKQ